MLDKFFNFQQKEAELVKLWEENQVAKPEKASNQNAEVFDITMPPPNANGELHIGHSYGHSVMDILARFKRLKGNKVLLVPGKDHAGIQTQVVFERILRDQGVDVENLSREEFYQKCYDFCLEKAKFMQSQEKTLGVTADFEREIFTLDPKVSDVVYQTFIKLWEDGLIYRGSRIVHWSIFSQTAISDEEVEYKEEKGNFWHIAYQLVETIEDPIETQKAEKTVNFSELSTLFVEKLCLMEKNEGNQQVICGILNDQNPQADVSLDFGHQLVLDQNEAPQESYLVYQKRAFLRADLTDEILEKYNDQLKAKIKKLAEKLVENQKLILIDLVPKLDRNDAIIIATTRPETMLGDTAIAVNPKDPRYQNLIGKKVKVPLIGREIAIIADERAEIAFGTGAVKITPAHDFLDYEIGKDHQLEEIQVIDQFGKMTALAGESYQGLGLLEARQKIVENLQAEAALVLVEEITHKVPIAERGKDIIEPLISKQWFLRVDDEKLSLKKKALDLLAKSDLQVHPARMKKQIVSWLENLNDWNISRQILWGHQMPVWYKNKDQENEEIHVGLKSPGEGWVQETDTFDTWFSSGQWPFSTLSALDLIDSDGYFPTHSMVMGRDILFFWACRMILLSSYRMNSIPWKNIYFTGLIRDSKGQKMSKSKGNGVEPTEIIQKYGVDALRLGLIVGTTAGLDPKFDEKKVESYGKFVNKIWNAAKLVEMKLEGNYQRSFDLNSLKLASSAWILKELKQVQTEFVEKLDNFDLTNAFELIYHFSWDIFCSWYLEVAKIQLGQTDSDGAADGDANDAEILMVMQKTFLEILKMLHCFMPMVTEEIYQNMDKLGQSETTLALNLYDLNWHQSGSNDVAANFAGNAAANAAANFAANAAEMEKVFDIVSAARELRRTLELGFAERLELKADFVLTEEARLVIEKMANLAIDESSDNMIKKPVRAGTIQISCANANKEQYFSKLKKQLEQLERNINIDEKRLNSSFIEKADADLVAEVRQNHQNNLLSRDVLKAELELN